MRTENGATHWHCNVSMHVSTLLHAQGHTSPGLGTIFNFRCTCNTTLQWCQWMKAWECQALIDNNNKIDASCINPVYCITMWCFFVFSTHSWPVLLHVLHILMVTFCLFSGYSFLLFQDEVSVQSLIEACIIDEDKLYWCVSSPTMKNKPVSLRPWLCPNKSLSTVKHQLSLISF